MYIIPIHRVLGPVVSGYSLAGWPLSHLIEDG